MIPVDEKITMLINPLMPIPNQATLVHGIADEMVKDSPTFAQLADSMHAYFRGNAVFGYNSNKFDVLMLCEEFARFGISWPNDEPLLDAYNIFQLKEPRTLAGAVKFYTGATFEDGHDAGRDVDATVMVIRRQLIMYPDLAQLPLHELELFCRDGKKRLDLAGKFYRNESGVICYAFGKDKDKGVKENPGFGIWMQKQSFPKDTINILNQILNGKLK